MGFRPSQHSSSPNPPGKSSFAWILVETLVVFLILALIVFVIAEVNKKSSAVQTNSTTRPTDVLPEQSSLVTGSPSSHVPTATAQTRVLSPTSDISALLTPDAQLNIQGIGPFPPDVDPLTGLQVEDPSRLERRPVMVKVSNYPRTGRPHAGLSFADIVFEYYIGYGLNRFAAIYLGQDASQVGPIRSGRLVNAQLGELYQSILVYGDADPTIDEVIVGELGDRALAEKYLPTPPKYRIGGGITVTNLFTNTAEVTDYVNDNQLFTNDRRNLHGMIFSDLIDPKSKIGFQVGIQYGKITRGEWHYDPNKGKYLGWIEEPKGDNDLFMIPWIDRLNNDQLAFSNIIVLFATYIEYAPTKHDIMLYDNKDGKRAVFFRDGLMSEGKWKTPNNGHPIQFTNSWGAPYNLKPGNTWIVLAGDSSIFEQAQEGQWELRFDLP